jgi:hypothetical protein
MERLSEIVDTVRHPLDDERFRVGCRDALDREGVLVLESFMTADALAAARDEAAASEHLAFYCEQAHNVYLTPSDPGFASAHPRNRSVVSSKGCITDDQIGRDSVLRVLYDAPAFRAFLCEVLGERGLHPYADPLSSVNVHYASAGQELGWHFDNSSFAITLLLQAPEAGGVFEYVRALRDAARGDAGYEAVRRVLDRETPPSRLSLGAGALVLFRGRDSMHRVTPVSGGTTRVLVVLAYNAEPGVALSESARMTFYGRLA